MSSLSRTRVPVPLQSWLWPASRRLCCSNPTRRSRVVGDGEYLVLYDWFVASEARVVAAPERQRVREAGECRGTAPSSSAGDQRPRGWKSKSTSTVGLTAG